MISDFHTLIDFAAKKFNKKTFLDSIDLAYENFSFSRLKIFFFATSHLVYLTLQQKHTLIDQLIVQKILYKATLLVFITYLKILKNFQRKTKKLVLFTFRPMKFMEIFLRVGLVKTTLTNQALLMLQVKLHLIILFTLTLELTRYLL